MRRVIFALLGVAACSSGTTGNGGVSLTDVQVRIAPAGATTAAIYFTASNAGPGDDTLRSIASSAGSISFHESRADAGMMQMVPVAEVVVRGSDTVRFAPGGKHGMLERFTRPLSVGDTVSLEFAFARSGVVRVTTSVLPIAGVE